MKKEIKYLVVIVCAVIFVYYYLPLWIPSLRAPAEELPESDVYKAASSNYSYNVLTSEASKKIYKNIEKASYSKPYESDNNVLCEFEESGDLDDTQFYLAYTAFCNDNPNVFWISFGINLKGDRFYVSSLYPADKLAEMKTQFKEVTEDFLRDVPEGFNQEELERYTHDYLLNQCQYDYDALDSNGKLNPEYENYSVIGTAYGALVNKKAVCSGYARAYQFLLNRLGVDCVCITGQGNAVDRDIALRYKQSDHMWNCVKKGPSWYMTDVTWDDVDDPTRQYDYYNLTSEEMYKDHFAEAIDLDKFEYYRFISLNIYGDCLFLPE